MSANTISTNRAGVSSNPNMHRNIFRGANLGSVFTDEQKAAIAAGTFDDLYVGDYWEIDGRKWLIADFDYWRQKSEPQVASHHVVIVPERGLYTAQMQNTEDGKPEADYTANTTAGAYINSDMRTKNLDQAREIIEAAFGKESIFRCMKFFANAAANGAPSAGMWYESDIDLMNEIMVWGTSFYTPHTTGSTLAYIVPYVITTDDSQLALFQLAPVYIRITIGIWPPQPYWLRDIASSHDFCSVGYVGYPNHERATNSNWVRPVFGIVGN